MSEDYNVYNGSFEGSNPSDDDNVLSWRESDTGEVFAEIAVPYGWTVAWDHSLGRPEMNVIEAVAPYLNPPRVAEGLHAARWFTFCRNHDVTLYQSMVVPVGASVSLSGLAHAWFSQYDDASRSQYKKDGKIFTIQDGEEGLDLFLGIDPTGGRNPWAESVVWEKANIYDHPDRFEVSSVDAEASVVTLFIRSKTLYPFKHCDVYVDGVSVSVWVPSVEPPAIEEPGVCPVPRLDYKRTVLVVPQNATKEQSLAAMAWAYANGRISVEFSVDDAMYAPGLTDITALLAWFAPDTWNKPAIIGFRDLWYPRCAIDSVLFYDPDGYPPTPPEEPTDPPEEPTDPPEEPTIPWVPERWIVKGTAGAFHTDGDRGQSDLARLLRDGGALYPTAKFVVDVGPSALMHTISPDTVQVLRVIDLDGYGNIESFSSEHDPVWQAEVRMRALMALMLKYKWADCKVYWEIINEQAPNSPEGWAAMGRFFIRAMDIADANGIKIACFSTSTGEPKIGLTRPDGSVEYDAWAAMASTGVFERMVRTPDGIPHAVAGHAYELTGDTYQLFRHRFLYNNHILPRMKAIGATLVPPFFMTEYGLPDDFMHYGPDYTWQHWVAFDREFRKDFYAGGFHTYINGYDEDYDDEYIALYGRYVAYAISQKDVVNG